MFSGTVGNIVGARVGVAVGTTMGPLVGGVVAFDASGILVFGIIVLVGFVVGAFVLLRKTGDRVGRSVGMKAVKFQVGPM